MRSIRTMANIGMLLVSSTLVLAAPRLSAAADLGQEICNISADGALGIEAYQQAIALHRAVLKRRPDDALAHYHLGFAYGMIGRLQPEIDQYRTAIKLGLRKWDLFVNLGLAYREQREIAKETWAFETAVTEGGNHPETHFNLALAYEEQNRLHEALREIAIARRMAPQDLEAANANAILCTETGDQECASRIWKELVKTAPSYAPARTNLAILRRASWTSSGHHLFDQPREN